MSIIDVIDQLEGLVSNGRRIVFTPSVVVNEEEILDLVDRMRLELPEEIKQARWTVEEQQRLIATAEEEAQGIVVRAEQEAARIDEAARHRADALVADHAVVRAAQEHAQTVVRDAEEHAARMRAEADTYVRDALEGLEAQLSRTMASVRKGIETLLPESDPARKRVRA